MSLAFICNVYVFVYVYAFWGFGFGTSKSQLFCFVTVASRIQNSPYDKMIIKQRKRSKKTKKKSSKKKQGSKSMFILGSCVKFTNTYMHLCMRFEFQSAASFSMDAASVSAAMVEKRAPQLTKRLREQVGHTYLYPNYTSTHMNACSFARVWI